MSSALSRASTLKPDIRLAQAVSEFEAGLSDKDKATFRNLRKQSHSVPPTPNDVTRITAEVDRQISKKFGSQCYGPRFQSFLRRVQQFAALGDVVVGGSQNLVACGVWSLVRMSLLSIVNSSTYVDRLSSLFMDIGRATPRYEEIGLLYPKSTKLQSYLNEYFIVVVRLCHYLFKFGQKPTIRPFSSNMSDSQLRTFSGDLQKWADLIKEQMQVCEAQENASSRSMTKDMFRSASDQQKYAMNRRVLNFCSVFDHETAWKQNRKAGNSSLHVRQSDYQEWKDGLKHRTLVCRGKLGSGKSVLLANIVDDLCLSTEQDDSLVAYFFCRHDVPESLQARTILGSLARQLLCTVPDLSVLAKSCENTHIVGDGMKAVGMLLQSFSASRKTYFVIDGLGECEFEEQETVIFGLRMIQDSLNVLICVSTREEPELAPAPVLDQLLLPLVMSLPENNPDIEAFINADIKRCIDKGYLSIGDPDLIEEIEEALLAGSQGMFLWATLQIQTICGMKTDYDIREALANLPRNLSDVFARILQKAGSSDLPLQAKTLQFVLAACRPLTTDELREALSVIPGDSDLDASRMLNNVYSALACCGCLLTVDEEEFTVRVVHPSVKQYILNELEPVDHASFSIEEAQRALGDAVVTYLNYGVFGTEVSAKTLRPLMAPKPSEIMKATIPSSRTSRFLAVGLPKWNEKVEVDLNKVYAQTRQSSAPKTEKTYHFYAYAKEHWQQHLLYVSGHKKAICKLSLRLLESRGLQFDLTDPDLWSSFLWSAENGCQVFLLQLLQSEKVDSNARDRNDQTPLIHAAKDGQKHAVKALLGCRKADVEAKEKYYERTALIYAAVQDHKEVVELLLDVGKADINAKEHFGMTALMGAVSHECVDIVEVLCGHEEVDVNASDQSSDTPLLWAASFGHRAMVECLLGTGKADVNVVSSHGETPLVIAVLSDRIDIVELLLRCPGIDLNPRSKRQETPLITAVRRNDAHMVELLLRSGKADVNAKDEDGSTPLMLAIPCNRKDIIDMLISGGNVDFSMKNGAGATALDLSILYGHEDLTELLRSHAFLETLSR